MQVDDIFSTMTEAMTKALNHGLHDFTTLHNGRLPGWGGHRRKVESYGSSMPIRDIAAVTTPDARTIMIQPWDKGVIKDGERAIQEANLGINPVADGGIIRLPIPELSGDRRKSWPKSPTKWPRMDASA